MTEQSASIALVVTLFNRVNIGGITVSLCETSHVVTYVKFLGQLHLVRQNRYPLTPIHIGEFVMSRAVIAPSILSANFACLGNEVDAVLKSGADWIHFDVMDNHYVPNLTIGPMVCTALREHGVRSPIDVHLMVTPVDDLIEAFIAAGASSITFHPEATQHIDRSLQIIRDAGLHCGLVFNPATPLHVLDYELESLDIVLLMSVNPGFGGQSFIPSTLAKLEAVRRRIDETGKDIRLQVDGGVKVNNIGQIQAAGADTFVAGSAIFNAASETDPNRYDTVIAEMRQALI